MLHFFTVSEADMIVGTFRQRMVPGSYLVISQGTASRAPREGIQDACGTDITLTGRHAAEIAAYFDGFDLLPPGLVPVADWPAPDASGPETARLSSVAVGWLLRAQVPGPDRRLSGTAAALRRGTARHGVTAAQLSGV